jgi:hypothetical protein
MEPIDPIFARHKARRAVFLDRAPWQELAEVWLQGFDGVPLARAGNTKPISVEMKAEVDNSAISKP